jgi:hypothetical protein
MVLIYYKYIYYLPCLTYLDVDVVSSNPAHVDVYLIQHYVSDFQRVGGFLRVLMFPPPIKMITMIQLKYF